MDARTTPRQHRPSDPQRNVRYRIGASELTERYIEEVLRYLPAGQRTPAGNKLRDVIRDRIRAHESGNEDLYATEHRVLTHMGEPAHMAARLAPSPLGLIGPSVYLQYMRVLTTLLAGAVPLLVIGVVALDLADGVGFTDGLLGGLVLLPGIAAQLFAVVTVAFVVVDRVGAHREARWSPDELPHSVPSSARNSVWPWISVVWDVTLLSLIVWQHLASPYTLSDGTNVPILNPDLFHNWMWPILIGLTGVFVLDLLRASRRQWTPILAGTHCAVTALFALPLAWVVSQHMIFDQRFLADFNQGWTTPDQFYSLTALAILIIAAGTCIDSCHHAFKQAPANTNQHHR